MTDDRTALVQALADAPADMAVRSVLADWLWEHDEDQLADLVASDSRLIASPWGKPSLLVTDHEPTRARLRLIGEFVLDSANLHHCAKCWDTAADLFCIWGAWHCKQCIIYGTELNLIPTPMMCRVCVVPAENEQPRQPVPGCPRCRGFGRVLWPDPGAVIARNFLPVAEHVTRTAAAMVDAFRVPAEIIGQAIAQNYSAAALVRIDQLADEEGE